MANISSLKKSAGKREMMKYKSVSGAGEGRRQETTFYLKERQHTPVQFLCSVPLSLIPAQSFVRVSAYLELRIPVDLEGPFLGPNVHA